jgi:hypothetical protein
MKTMASRCHAAFRSKASMFALLAATALPCLLLPLTACAKPPLLISNDYMSADLGDRIYSHPRRATQIDPAQISGTSYYDDIPETVVGHKIDQIRDDLSKLQQRVNQLSQALAAAENEGQRQAAQYYASIATISTQLQSGTTPGNPRLVSRLNVARNNLETLSTNITGLNDIAIQISNAASQCSYLLETARATYSLSGGVEEDHDRLAHLEDAINNTVVVIDRILNNVNDDITRTTAYLGTERDNLRTLSLAITTGDMFGRSLSNHPFALGGSSKADFVPASAASYGGAMPAGNDMSGAPAGGRPLVKIRFDRPDVNYEQPVYMAVNEALKRYPNARFELVAVHPSRGNVAEVAIESTRARRNAEKVLRSLQQMGVDLNRVNLSYAPSDQATTNEVHIYVR